MKIGILGTFDVENYGDLLFPLLAAKKLSERMACECVALSPVGGNPVWGNCFPSYPLQHVNSCEGVLVGGGNIIRISAATLKAYQKDTQSMAGYPMLWVGPAEYAPTGLAVCWNAPGVPEAFSDYKCELARLAMESADYLAVRDDQSRQFLMAVWGEARIKVVPDTAWEVNQLWTPTELDAAYKRAVKNQNVKTVAFHVNERYLRDLPLESVAGLIDLIASRFDATPLLLALGPCHGDSPLTRRIGALSKANPIVIDQPESLVQVAACISRSVAYIGSSMHGFITAASFDVPALIVAVSKGTKFAGLETTLSCGIVCVDSWTRAYEITKGSYLADLSHRIRTVRPKLNTALDEHWQTVATIFKNGRQKSTSEIDIRNKIIEVTFQDVVSRFVRQQERMNSISASKREKRKT